MKFSVDFSEIYQLLGENMKTPKLLYNKVVWTLLAIATRQHCSRLVEFDGDGVGVLVHGSPRTRA